MKCRNLLRAMIVPSCSFLLLAGCRSSSRPDEVAASGTIEATQSSIAAQVAGRVIKLNDEEGAVVRQGDTLAETEHRSLVQQARQAQASLAMAKQQYDLLAQGARSEDLRVGEETVKQAQASCELAKLAFDRTRSLFSQHSVSQSQMDDAQERYTVASTQLSAAQQNLEKLKHYTRPEELRRAGAQVEEAQAAYDNASINLEHSFVISPINGSVVDKLVEIGDYANVGTPLYTLADMRKMKMTVYVNEVDLAKVRIGDQARVVLDGMPDHPFDGTVIYISSTAEFTPKNVETKEDRVKLVFAVKIEIANPEGYLKAGLPADALISTKAQPPISAR